MTDTPAIEDGIPPGLSAEAVMLWNGYHADLAADEMEPDARERAVLVQACLHLTTVERLHDELVSLDSVMVPGSRNNHRVSPLVSEIDKYRRSVALLLRSITPTPAEKTAARKPTRRSAPPRTLGIG